ncbi:MAG: PqqD family protein [Lachnospiraceae bacterium]|nr:PqqD family protein [Lachnospiraceae bacterium]
MGIDRNWKDYKLERVIGTEWLVHTAQSGEDYEKVLPLNNMGAEICQLLIEGNTEDQVVEMLSEKYKVDLQEMKQDVHDFLEQL